MSFYLCCSEEYSTRPGSVRDNGEIEVLECQACGLVYLSSQSHIEDGHYENSGMHDGESPDIETWIRETQPDSERRYQFLKERMTNRRVLDFGCGIGGFLDHAKDTATAVAGIELETSPQPSYQSRGLAVFPSL